MKKKLSTDVTEKRDHCQVTGEYRGAGHPTINLNV